MKVLIFAKDENLRFFKPLLTWVMTQNVETSMTTPNFILTCSSRALNKYYNFQVADYQYITATLSYRSLWYLKSTLTCRLAALQHIPRLHSTFDGNRASLQHQQHRLMSLNRLRVLFIYNLDIDAYRVLQNFAKCCPHRHIISTYYITNSQWVQTLTSI